jgi:hypothetical protein
MDRKKIEIDHTNVGNRDERTGSSQTGHERSFDDPFCAEGGFDDPVEEDSDGGQLKNMNHPQPGIIGDRAHVDHTGSAALPPGTDL